MNRGTPAGIPNLPRRPASRFSTLPIAVLLSAGSVFAQTIVTPELELPKAATELPPESRGTTQQFLRLIQRGEWTKAARIADDSTRGAIEDPSLHYLIGVVRWQQLDKLAAIQHFYAAEELGLRTPYLHKAFGLAYYDANQFVLFEQQMERAIATDAGDPQPHFHLGRYIESVKSDFAGALQHFERVISLDPEHTRGQYFAGFCLEMLDRRNEAAERYQAAVQVSKRNDQRFSWPYQGLARLAIQTDPDQARLWAEKAVELEPEVFENHFVVARVRQQTGEFSQAVAAANEAVRVNPNHAASHYLLFTANRKLGHMATAQRHLSMFQKLKKLYGDH